MQTIAITYELEELNSVANKVLEYLNSKVIVINGMMGAGKTTLINALIKAMNSEDVATSPTFSIVNEYRLPNDRVYHFDFYRIETIEEAYNFGVEDYLNTDNWIFIEWAERVEELVPLDAQKIDIEILEDNKRTLKLTINKSITEDKAMTEPKF
ncbi:tRNA (adenosine(37)-N6)-threonylcarbamoyltransferase complex ATPase subunit type 1 TsaE [Winogradskyella sp.]|uniref:tRNA (adenosine(37)-N6)-threonylcarbamoyltransferase complex ATPase subunit type 1 TsaE n=1 Tax=Winogradskyella sp. TaxID=1883156 RepID=UPI003704C51C